MKGNGEEGDLQAVILAAGVGSRLRPITLQQPKGCIPIAGRSILAHQLHAYADAGVEDVTVVAGYLHSMTRAHCEAVAAEREDLSVTVVENDRYANTNNLYSLYQVREAVGGEPFLVSNGDVVFDPSVLDRLIASDAKSAIACDPSTFSEEAMKVALDDNGYVDRIGKSIPQSEAFAPSIDVYRFSGAFSARLFDRAERLLFDEERYDAWSEVALDAVLGTRREVRPVDIEGAPWVEIDDHDDLRQADRTFGSLPLSDAEVVFFDLDGTIYVGDSLVPGARSAVAALRERGTDVFFLSNNSSGWKTDYADKLDALGVPADADDVILSTDGVISYLDERGVEATYVVGTTAMQDAIADQGIVVDAEDPDCVVVGFDTELTYEKVRRATLAIRDGAEFLLAHADTVCPTAEGFVPDCGAIGALVETAADRPPTRVFGKPNPEMISHVLDERNLAPEDAVVVGDRLATEIRLADTVGCHSACVLSGDATRADVAASDVQPSVVLDTVGDLERYLDGASD